MPLAAHQHGLGHGGQAVLHRQDGPLRIAGRLLIAPVQSGQEGPHLGGPVPQNLVGGGDGGGAEVEEGVHVGQVDEVDLFARRDKLLVLPVGVDPGGVGHGAQGGDDVAHVHGHQLHLP